MGEEVTSYVLQILYDKKSLRKISLQGNLSDTKKFREEFVEKYYSYRPEVEIELD